MTCTLGKESGYYCKCKLKHLEDLTQGNNMIKFYIFKRTNKRKQIHKGKQQIGGYHRKMGVDGGKNR